MVKYIGSPWQQKLGFAMPVSVRLSTQRLNQHWFIIKVRMIIARMDMCFACEGDVLFAGEGHFVLTIFIYQGAE